MQGAKRHIVDLNKSEKRSTLDSVWKHPNSISDKPSDMDSNSDNSNVVFIGGDSLSPAGHNIQSRENETRPNKGKMISVTMGSPREINLSKADPLRQQEVRDALYKKEKRSLRPAVKYDYD